MSAPSLTVPFKDETAFDRLHHDWQMVCAVPGHAESVIGWLVEAGVVVGEQAPADLPELLRTLSRLHRAVGRVGSDAWLRVLLERARAGGDDGRLAAAVVVQAMLPSAVRTAGRLRRGGRGFADAAHVVAGCLYEAVLTYPLERCPRRIAANISLNTLREARRELDGEISNEACEPLDGELDVARRAPDGVEPDVFEEVAARQLAQAAVAVGMAPGGDPDEQLIGARRELVELLLWAREQQLLGADAVEAICDHYRDGALPDAVAASAAGVGIAAWKKRRSRAVGRLKGAAGLWLAEAA
ncbi:hypothetical protein [Streptantibioticus ferralitis]|uniref:Uncharacterized protein n=1 Tax=Streptantibioticus ferralitis TaxID=236510 RepID=A0ABT5Z767_9ACTN|nr:hypothetical protein [Streptantibioticus ferralitis]MDF2259671.1 hypothetical protein [Streptantibioticus ferralitis]